MYIENPKTKGSGILAAIPHKGKCPLECKWCFYNERSYLDVERETPNMPSPTEALGRVVRVNDGGDSSNDWPLAKEATALYVDKFYNTSQVFCLKDFDAPVVLTVNPGEMTDNDLWLVDKEECKNIMFVRFRVNTWNISLAKKCIKYYDAMGVPTVLTPMAYPSLLGIPDEEMKWYEWGKRTINEYWKLTEGGKNVIRYALAWEKWSWCEGECKSCGNCLREYYRKKEELRDGGD
jgi:hypothetical protein